MKFIAYYNPFKNLTILLTDNLQYKHGYLTYYIYRHAMGFTECITSYIGKTAESPTKMFS